MAKDSYARKVAHEKALAARAEANEARTQVKAERQGLDAIDKEVGLDPGWSKSYHKHVAKSLRGQQSGLGFPKDQITPRQREHMQTYKPYAQHVQQADRLNAIATNAEKASNRLGQPDGFWTKVGQRVVNLFSGKGFHDDETLQERDLNKENTAAPAERPASPNGAQGLGRPVAATPEETAQALQEGQENENARLHGSAKHDSTRNAQARGDSVRAQGHNVARALQQRELAGEAVSPLASDSGVYDDVPISAIAQVPPEGSAFAAASPLSAEASAQAQEQTEGYVRTFGDASLEGQQTDEFDDAQMFSAANRGM